MRRLFTRINGMALLALVLLAGIVYQPATERWLLSHKVPTTTPAKQKPATTPDDWFPLLSERINQPVTAYPIGTVIPFFQWLWSVRENRQPIEQRHADGKTLIGICPPAEFRSALGASASANGSVLATRGPFDIDASVRLIKSPPEVTLEKSWRTKIQFQALMLRAELRKVMLFLNNERQEAIEKEWVKTHQYVAWHTPKGELGDLYDATFDFGGNLHSHAAINAISKTLSEWRVDWFYEMALGKFVGERPYSDHPDRVSGATLRIKFQGMPSGVKVSVYDRLTGRPTLALEKAELSCNDETAVNVKRGDPVNIIVETNIAVAANPPPDQISANGDAAHTLIPRNATEYTVTVMPYVKVALPAPKIAPTTATGGAGGNVQK